MADISDWKPIETCPRVVGKTYLGYDANTAMLHGRPEDGLCLITWLPDEDGMPSGWEVQPFNMWLDAVFDSDTDIRFWRELSSLVFDLPARQSQEGEDA